jgi:hypothetical protein
MESKNRGKSLKLVESKSNVKARYLGLELNTNFFTKSLEWIYINMFQSKLFNFLSQTWKVLLKIIYY